MSALHQPYVRHYDVPLLDDLHNYFPELLYGSLDQFPNVASVLTYVRERVRARFDLFSAGQRAAVGVSVQPPSVPARQQPLNRATTTAGAGGAAAMSRAQFARNAEAYRSQQAARNREARGAQEAASSIMSLMQDMLNPAPAPLSSIGLLNLALGGGFGGGGEATISLPPTFMEPVPVRPTPAQVAEATVIEDVDAEEEVCAICQDAMPRGSEARSLRACDHRFHVGCIDTWFQRDVRCPVCRHDIREPADHPLGSEE